MKEQYHLVSFSGGKDSTAMLLGMLERDMKIDCILFLNFLLCMIISQRLKRTSVEKLPASEPSIPMRNSCLMFRYGVVQIRLSSGNTECN